MVGKKLQGKREKANSRRWSLLLVHLHLATGGPGGSCCSADNTGIVLLVVPCLSMTAGR